MDRDTEERIVGFDVPQMSSKPYNEFSLISVTLIDDEDYETDSDQGSGWEGRK